VYDGDGSLAVSEVVDGSPKFQSQVVALFDDVSSKFTRNPVPCAQSKLAIGGWPVPAPVANS
jgi:hypothetical protein